MAIKIFAILASFLRSLFDEINVMNFFNTGVTFTLEEFILCKNVWGGRALEL